MMLSCAERSRRRTSAGVERSRAHMPDAAPRYLAALEARDALACACRAALGVPAVNVPGLAGPTGLPLGVQLVGQRGADARTLRAAAWVGERLGMAPGPAAG